DDVQGFVDELLDGQPDAHAYFSRMKRQNLRGPALLAERHQLQELAVAQIARDIEHDAVTFIDTRPVSDVHEETVADSISLPRLGKIASYAAWALDPETDHRPVVVLAEDRQTAEQIRDHLVRVGIDNVTGYVTDIAGLPTQSPRIIQPEELDGFGATMILDVRNKTEHAEGHIPGSHQLSAGRVLWHQDELPDDGTVVTYCQTGARNSVVASALRRAGHDIVELDGSYEAWSRWAEHTRHPATA